MEENQDVTQGQDNEKHIHRGRDVWTNRVVGWATGAIIPILLLMIPVATRWMDDVKELEKLRITNTMALTNLNTRVTILEEELAKCKSRCP